MKILLWIFTAFLSGLLIGFVVFGIQILPKTVWTWSLGKPLEMQGEISAPILVWNHDNDDVYYVTEYKTPTDTTWIFTKYYKFHYTDMPIKHQPGIWEYNTATIELKTTDFDYQSMPPYFPLPAGYIGFPK